MDSPRRKGIRGEGGDILTSLTRRIPQRLNPGLERGSKVGRCRGLPPPFPPPPRILSLLLNVAKMKISR